MSEIAHPPSTLHAQLHIMIVDDQPLDVELVVHALASLAPSARRTVFLDPTDAVRALETWAREEPATLPDLILLDLNMPRLNGYQVLTHLRTLLGPERCNVVVCSTSSDPANVEQAFALGANGYFIKPLTYTLLEAVLRAELPIWTNVPCSGRPPCGPPAARPAS